MIPVLISWVAYVYLAIQIFFHGLRFGSFLTSVGILVVLFFVLVFWAVHRITAPARRVNRQTAQLAQAPVSASQIQTITFRVAGTTFENSDGSSRQDILGSFASVSDDDLNVTFLETSYEGAPAIEVYINEEQVGFVPKKKIPTMQVALASTSWTVDEVRILGGGTAADGTRLSYGAEITGSWM